MTISYRVTEVDAGKDGNDVSRDGCEKVTSAAERASSTVPHIELPECLDVVNEEIHQAQLVGEPSQDVHPCQNKGLTIKLLNDCATSFNHAFIVCHMSIPVGCNATL